MVTDEGVTASDLAVRDLYKRVEHKAEREPISLNVREVRALVVELKVAADRCDEAEALAWLGR